MVGRAKAERAGHAQADAAVLATAEAIHGALHWPSGSARPWVVRLEGSFLTDEDAALIDEAMAHPPAGARCVS